MSFDSFNISKADAEAYSSSDDDQDDDEDYHLRPSTNPREDEFGDFNPRKRRRTGRDAKESAALGIFGSDSEDDRPGRRWKSKQNLRHRNMTFVSSGRKQANDNMDEGEDEGDEDGHEDESDDAYGERPGLGARAAPQQDEYEDEDEDEEMTGMSGVGLGFRPSAQGLGFAPPTQSNNFPTLGTPSKPPPIKNKYDGKTALGRGFVPSSANEPVLRTDLEEDASSAAPPPAPKPSAFGGGGKAKSFAAKMMAKMGYVEGQGLGASNQGRAQHIQAVLRPQGNLGLGSVKEKSEQERKEEKRQARLRGEEVSDSDSEKKKKREKNKQKKNLGLDSGSASGASTPKRPKTKYLTVNDIQKAAPGLHIPDAFAPILDLTGRDQKLLTSSSGLLTPTAGTEAVKQSEAGKLARRAQGDLGAFVEEWKNLQEKKAWLDMQIREGEQALADLQTDLTGLETFHAVLDEISAAARSREWDPVIAGLKKAEAASKTKTQDEDLAALTVASIHPFVRDAVQGWQPLEDPKLGNFTSDLADMRGILGLDTKPENGRAVAKWEVPEVDGTHRYHQRSTTPYESMIYKHIFPKLVTTISQWDVHDPTPLLAVFDRWDQLFPSFVRSQLLEQVARRLSEAVGNWKPKKKQPIHLWTFPWLERLPAYHLDPRGSGLVADVRRKFRQLIDGWDYQRGVVPGLKEWKGVFRPSRAREQDQWRPLVMHHVLPGMARYLRANFRVDPADQEPYVGMLEGALRWAEEGIVAPSALAEVLVAEVFTLWRDALWRWLVRPEANYEEVGAWFEWWQRDALPADITAQPSIAAEFEAGTALIEKALDLGDDAPAKLPRPDTRPAYHHRHHHHDKDRQKEKAAAAIAAEEERQKAKEKEGESKKKEPTFRDEVEDWCQDNDLQFIPVRRANDMGLHYFRITARMDGRGGVLAYFSSAAPSGADGGAAGVGEALRVESRKMGDMVLPRDKRDQWELLSEKLLQEV